MAELEDAKTDFSKWVTEYNKVFIRYLDLYSRRLRPCHVNSPIAGVHYIEVKRFSRAQVYQQSQFTSTSCSECPWASSIDELSQRTHTTIYNCKIFGEAAIICAAKLDSPRDYLWWRSTNGRIYGHNSTCPNIYSISGGVAQPVIVVPVTVILPHCQLCVCSVDQNKTSEDNGLIIGHISETEQISDIWNNKVVTGIKFIVHENAIHLQIQETAFSLDGLNHTESTWKALDHRYLSNGTIQTNTKITYTTLTHERKTFLLDHVHVPSYHAVTGVKFTLIDDTIFTLTVHATRFEIETGKLLPRNSFWFVRSEFARWNKNQFYSERTEVDLSNADDPLRGLKFKYIDGREKLIKLTHTNLEKDAGQTTIPFFDAQPVQAMPPFPLGGIGLSYRESDGYGGYIAPTLQTINIREYMLPH